ncbi:unnamed protein product [Ranitomeya imitator]|uniref:Peptidase S1 domain-containing protein n=1 Tax=Ranitomeya imitator TaxID=111125 RepID=A0ABN9LEH2_9NEOB|nr:unnamed protein product [Ranitomeya imitator]
MKHGGVGVMVWVCFAGDTVVDLFKIEGILNQHGVHSILQRYAIPSGLRLAGPSFIFQQDNDSKHTSRLCKGYLTKKESDGVLRQMTWPPQSPDLNPIKMVWGELDRRVKAKGPTSAKHLWELLQFCWTTIPGDYLLKLIKRMPRVCKAVIKAKATEPSDILQEAQVQLIPNNKCNSPSWYNGDGDSGGPLMCKEPNARIFSVVGITSWGSGCAQARSPAFIHLPNTF